MSVHALVLAAGVGKRLWPLTSTRPKPLMPLPGGGSLLSRLLTQLEGIVDGVTVVVSPGEPGRLVVGEAERVFGAVRVAYQERRLGTGDAVRIGLKQVPRSADRVLIIYGDLFVSRDLLASVADYDAAVAAVPSSEPWNYGVVYSKDGCLERVVEKPRGAAPGSLVNTGIYVLPRSELEPLIADIKLSPRGEYELTDVVNALASRVCVRVVSDSGWFWIDVGRPWDLFKVYKQFFGEVEKRIEGEVEPGAVVKGEVYVAPQAVVRSGSIVEGPAWIEGEVGPLARIRPWSFLLRGSRAGAFTEVKASIFFPHARAPHLNYVGDSILGEGVNLGAGTVTANLRFDHSTVKVTLKGKLVDTGLKKLGTIFGDWSQTGINVSLLPGTRVGAYSWVYPGITVKGDIPDCSLAVSSGGKILFKDLSASVECKLISRGPPS